MAFDLWQLDELYLEVFADNQAALNVYRRNGFTPRNEKDGIVHMVLGRADHRGGVNEGVLPSS
jgi:RimJ/RimL family protein N-acetyltransferase